MEISQQSQIIMICSVQTYTSKQVDQDIYILNIKLRDKHFIFLEDSQRIFIFICNRGGS